MGPIEFIGAGAKGLAKFAKTHAAATALTLGAAGVGGYVAYDNYKGADGANGGGVVKRDVAVNDKNGDLRVKMQGLGKEAAKANESAQPDAKSDTGNAAEKYKEALNAAKDADIKAEAAQAVEQPGMPTETPYIPETAAADAVDASANVLDGNGSAAFKPAHFASSGGGSTAYEQSRGGQSSGATTSGNASNGSTVKVAKSGGKPEELEGKTSATPASGKAEIKKETAKTGGNDNKGGDGSKTETGKEILSDGNNASERKGETENSPNNGGETGPQTGGTPVNVTTTTNVEDTVSTVAAPIGASDLNKSSARGETEKRGTFFEKGGFSNTFEMPKQKKDDERERLRETYLNALRNAFKEEADIDVDDVVSPSDRTEAGIAATTVMKLATEPTMRVKEVTLDIDSNQSIEDLRYFLTFLGQKKQRGDFNPNVRFLLPNGSKFLDEKDTIPGVKLETVSTAVRITFPDAKPSTSDTKKPDAGKTKGEIKGETAKETESDLTEAGAGATGSGGATATMTKAPTGGTAAIEPPDWMQTLWNNAEEEAEEALIKRVGENHSLMPSMHPSRGRT